MPKRTRLWKMVLLLAAVFLLADAASDVVPAWNTQVAGYLFQLTAAFIALGACCWRATKESSQTKGLWILFALGLGIWTSGLLLAAWEDLFQHFPFEIASLDDFSFFFYGVPILFALSTPVEGERSRLFTWLDGGQAVFAGYLTYVRIFGILPFSAHTVEPISIPLLVTTYNAEAVMLVVCCALRLMASPRGGVERSFFGTLGIFLGANALGVGIYNHVSMVSADHKAPDFPTNLPFILLGCLIVLLRKPEQAETSELSRKNRLALFIDVGSPVLFTLALLTLGLMVLRTHFYAGMAAIGFSLAVYVVRTTILQIRYMQAQGELRSAKDRLEELSLQDALTGVANRRNFDQTLDAEWRRATRSGSSLSLLFIDLDHFKNVNDLYGHPYGDRCLIEVAGALRSVAFRSSDLVARYGGEEFAVVLPHTTREAASILAERIRQAVLVLRIPNETPLGEFVTVSIGVTTSTSLERGSPETLIEASDRALYRAKQSGRNRVEHTWVEQPVLLKG